MKLHPHYQVLYSTFSIVCVRTTLIVGMSHCTLRVNERCRRKEERSKHSHTYNKAKQHSTRKAVIFQKKNELPWVGLEPMTLYTYMYMHEMGSRK